MLFLDKFYFCFYAFFDKIKHYYTCKKCKTDFFRSEVTIQFKCVIKSYKEYKVIGIILLLSYEMLEYVYYRFKTIMLEYHFQHDYFLSNYIR